MIPELPSIEDHYSKYSSCSSPMRKNTATNSSTENRSMQKRQRKSIVQESLVDAIRISDLCSPVECLLDDVLDDLSSTAPLTDDENEYGTSSHNTSNALFSNRDPAGSATTGAPLLGGNHRWQGTTSNNDCKWNNNDGKDEKHILHAINVALVNRNRQQHDSAPICPVRSPIRRTHYATPFA